MTSVTGEIAVMMDALGCRQGDSRILKAIALLSPDMTVEEFDFDGQRSTYFTFKSAGTDLLFESDVLVSIMVRVQPDGQDETYGLYPRPVKLVEGLPPTASRAEVVELLGDPERIGPNFDRYEVNNHYLHFEFDPNARVNRITTMLDPV